MGGKVAKKRGVKGGRFGYFLRRRLTKIPKLLHIPSILHIPRVGLDHRSKAKLQGQKEILLPRGSASPLLCNDLKVWKQMLFNLTKISPRSRSFGAYRAS